MNETSTVRDYFNNLSTERDQWKKKASYYHNQLEAFFTRLIPKGKKVIEIGCGTGALLSSVKPKIGLGIDISNEMIKIATKKYPKLKFIALDAQNLSTSEKFDYIILSDLIGNLEDVQKALDQLHKISNEKSRIIVSSYNFLWEPILSIAEVLGLKIPQPKQNWLSGHDIENFLFLSDFEVVKKGTLILIPVKIPLISSFLNRYLAKLPLIKHLCLVQYFIARKKSGTYSNQEYSVSVVVPARNEAGNIERVVLRIPKLGKSTEIIIVEGGSEDNTVDEARRVVKKYKNKKDVKLIFQEKVGKGNAVRKGFKQAKGDVLMILDADLTVAPEDLLKFYHAIRLRKGEFVMGSRLVYPLEAQAMRFLNILGNNFFSIMFSFLLEQPIKDTLCGTKVIFKEDYQDLAKNRQYFGDFDPFGDFDLIFGASKLNLKILEIPIRYKARTYGTSNISRFKHGWMLLKMTLFAARKIKFI